MASLERSNTKHPSNTEPKHLSRQPKLYFLVNPPRTFKTGQHFSVTIGLPHPHQQNPSLPPPPPKSQDYSEAVHLSLRLAVNNAAANLLSGNLTSTITCVNGHAPSSVTFDGICVVRAGLFRLRALLGIDEGGGVKVVDTVDSGVFEVLG
jgi:hypothetical protein